MTVRCAIASCPFRIHASCKLKQLDQLFVKNIQLIHTCGGGFRSLGSPTINSDLVKSLIVNQIRDEPKRKTKDIIKSFRRDYDVELSYYFAYKGKKLAMNDIFGDEKKSYNELVWYLKALERNNLNSYSSMDVDSNTNQFERVFVCYEACIFGFNYCRPMVFLDATFLKGRSGILMAATAKNENQGTDFDLFFLLLYLCYIVLFL